jgi:hypothetical protein
VGADVDLRILGAVGAVVAIVAIAVIPRRLAPKHLFEDNHASRLGVENEIRRTIIQMLGGSFVLASVFFTYETVRISQQSLTLTERGQITERFTRAIDQMGSGELDVAAGGIYALGQIARESETEYHPIMDILIAFIHRHSPLGRRCRPGHAISGDVQAAIAVIGTRNRAFETPGETIDLTRVDLSSADFSGADFEGVDFRGSCLQSANFDHASLEGANFSSYRLGISGAVSVQPTILTGATFRGAHAPKAEFVAARMTSSTMSDANLEGADLSFAVLGHRGRVSTGGGADLSGADLSGANLSDATLGFVGLYGADLSGADISERQLERALIDEETILP